MDTIRNPIVFIGFVLPMDNLGLTLNYTLANSLIGFLTEAFLMQRNSICAKYCYSVSRVSAMIVGK